jgi:uncharacterized protein YecE (DUF72 family)
MEFGRLPRVDDVDFRMPEDPAWNERLLGRVGRPDPAATPSAFELRMGMASWSDPRLVDRLGGSRENALSVHSRAVPSNELNSTFYGYEQERLARWSASVPPGFKFCPKLPSSITHERLLENADEEMEAFVAATDALGATRGLTWFALPPYVPTTHRGRLMHFLARWSPRLPLAIEVRHPSWFERRAFEELVVQLADLGVTFILTDTAGRRDALHMHLSSGATMIRFVANALHPTDYERLDAWVERLADWSKLGLQEAYFFFHQKNEAETVDLAEHLEKRLLRTNSNGLEPVLGPWRSATGYRSPAQQLDLFG